jgi:ankyrin repeat protein
MSLAYHVERNDIEEVKRLLKQNVSVDERCDGNKTALYSACERGYVEIAELLIQHGASINRRPIPLMAASRNGHEACVQLLLRHNANVHSTNVKGLSAMDGACKNMHFSIVELLLDHGASLPDQL